MTDERLRALEHAYRASGAEEAELAWLSERVRTGSELEWAAYARLQELDIESAVTFLRGGLEDQDPHTLDLLCRLRHEPALRLTGRRARQLRVEELAGQPEAVVLAVATAAALAAFRRWDSDLQGDRRFLHNVAKAILAWIEDPSPERREAIARVPDTGRSPVTVVRSCAWQLQALGEDQGLRLGLLESAGKHLARERLTPAIFARVLHDALVPWILRFRASPDLDFG